MNKENTLSILQNLQLMSGNTNMSSGEVQFEGIPDDIKEAVVNCLITVDSKQQKVFINTLVSELKKYIVTEEEEQAVASFLDFFLHSNDWQKEDNKIDCFKYFCMNQTVLQYVKTKQCILNILVHFTVETIGSYPIGDFCNTNSAIRPIIELQSLFSLIHVFLRQCPLSNNDSSFLIQYIKEVIEQSTTPFLISFLTSCCSLLIKLEQPSISWKSLRLEDSKLSVILLYSEMKQNYKQLLVEEVDGANCEALYQQTIKITLSTEDTLTKQFMLLLWDMLIQLLSITHVYLSPSIQQQFVDYSIEFAISLSFFNNRNNIAKDLFTHLLPSYPQLALSNPSYSALLQHLISYTSMNSNLASLVLSLLPFIHDLPDYHLIMKYLVSSVYSSRVKSDSIAVLKILLQQVPSTSISSLLQTAIHSAYLPIHVQFRTEGQKLAQKGFLFLIPYFMEFLNPTDQETFLSLLVSSHSPSLPVIQSFSPSQLCCILATVYHGYKQSQVGSLLQQYATFIYENNEYFFSFPKQYVRLLAFQISVLLSKEDQQFYQLLSVPILKNNSTYIEPYKESLKLLLSNHSLLQSIPQPSVEKACSIISSLFCCEIEASVSTSIQSIQTLSLLDLVLLQLLQQYSCDENTFVLLQCLLQQYQSQLHLLNPLVLLLLISYLLVLIIHRDGKTRNYSLTIFSYLPLTLPFLQTTSLSLFYSAYCSFFFPILLSLSSPSLSSLLANPEYANSEFSLLHQSLQNHQQESGWLVWEKCLIEIRLKSPRIFIYSSGIQLLLLRLKRISTSQEEYQDLIARILQEFYQQPLCKQPSQPTFASLLHLLQLMLKNRTDLVNSINQSIFSLLSLIIANCFRNLAIASGQGKQAIDLEGKIEDLNEMTLPDSLLPQLTSSSTESQLECIQYAIQIIKTTALVSGNSNCVLTSGDGEDDDEENDEENDESLTVENDGPKAIDVVSNWEAVKEGIILLVQLVKQASIKDEEILFALCSYLIEMGSNSLHQGILQQIHFSLIDLLDYYYSIHSTSRSFIQVIARIMSIPVTIHLPIIRRSAGLPFMIHSVLTVLNHYHSPLLPVLIQIIHDWTEEQVQLSPSFIKQVSSNQMIAQFIDFYSTFIQSSSIQYETDNVRSRSNKLSVLVHSLNILKSLLSSPELTSHFHSYYPSLLKHSIYLLDHSNWNVKSAAAQLLACVIKRVFRSRRRKGENERINRVSDIAIMMEFPRLFPMLTSMLQAATESHSQYTFAILLLFQRVNCESKTPNEILFNLLFPYISSSHYLVRQAACRAIPSILPLSSLYVLLHSLPQHIKQAYNQGDMNLFSGLIQLMEMIVRYLTAGDSHEDHVLCLNQLMEVIEYLNKTKITLVQMHLLQMIECISHEEILFSLDCDDLIEITEEMKELQVCEMSLLPEDLIEPCKKLIIEFVLPFIVNGLKNPHFEGDSLFAVQNGLKCVFSIVVHLTKEERDSIVQEVYNTIDPIISNFSHCMSYYNCWKDCMNEII